MKIVTTSLHQKNATMKEAILDKSKTFLGVLHDLFSFEAPSLPPIGDQQSDKSNLIRDMEKIGGDFKKGLNAVLPR